ncbi:putative hydroxypyruvate reductase [Rubripirellula amarantea]|uniref:Putative hydroxypyruvate reductase n=1 Tax=Rubripirellula amarantea TaxID=2527999 RepID=A0A5C5WJM7_9BACT|nr:DUF4147 domain-containing protein [Rubripirellula amarantea]TWT50173.1 putative hydroxypyruvate reductase [Rubripirellula amarantea]
MTKHPTEDATAIWNAGLDAVRAKPLVTRAVSVDGDQLLINEHSFFRSDYDRVLVIGAGKAASAMAQGLQESLHDWLPISGWVNVPEGTQTSIPGIVTHPARPAGVNEPTQAGVEGTRKILDLAASAGPRDLVIALISGGGSALLPLPKPGITLADKLAVIRHLSSSGATINELNTVRKHLSDIKGGGLLRACERTNLVTLILSDVLGDPLDLIASGPTVADTSTPQDAIDVLARFDAERELPHRIYDVINHSDVVRAKPAINIVIGNNAVAVDEAGIKAESLGYNHVMQCASSSEGLADQIGRHLAAMTVAMLRADANKHRNDCLLQGGEPTVELCAAEQRGLGGRNQHLVLAAYEELLSIDLSIDEWNRLCLLSGGTDGEDGPTDAAGAYVDAKVHHNAVQLGLNPADYLARNNAYRFFEQAGGLLITGPTGTNVCDVRVALVT